MIRIVTVNISVITFAMIMGKSFVNKPYISQRNIPRVSMIYIVKDRSFVCFVLIIRTACGRNEIVVQVAATNPSIIIIFILF